jgi:predicted nuclease of predicted toxin-antitoxin system
MRLLLDEHLSPRVAQALRARGYDVVCALEVGLGEKQDLEVWRWAVGDGRCLVSYNACDFAKLFQEFFHQGVHHPGLVLIQAKTIGQHDTGAQVRALGRLLLEAPDRTDQLVFLGRP